MQMNTRMIQLVMYNVMQTQSFLDKLEQIEHPNEVTYLVNVFENMQRLRNELKQDGITVVLDEVDAVLENVYNKLRNG